MVSGSIATTLLAAIESIIISRILGPEATGQYQLAITITITVVTLLSVGIGQANIYFISTQEFSDEKIVNTTLVLSIIFGSISTIILQSLFYFFNKFTGNFSKFVIISISLSSLFVLLHVFFGQILIAKMRILQFNISAFLSKMFSIIVLLLLAIFNALNIENALIIVVLQHILAAFITMLFIKEYIFSAFAFDFCAVKKTICYGAKIHFGNLLFVLDHNLSTIFIGLLLPGEFEGIGYFTRAIAVCTFIRFIPISLSNLLYAYWAKNNTIEMVLQLERAVRIYILFGSLVFIALILYGQDLISMFYGKAFIPAYSILKILSIQQILWIVANVFQSFYLAAGNPKLITYNLLICNLISAIGMLIFIPLAGVIGAAYAITVAHAINLFLNLYIAKKKYSLSPYSCFRIGIVDFIFFYKKLRRGLIH